MKRERASLLAIVCWLLATSAGPSAQAPEADDVPPRIARLETWLKAVEQHRPGVLDEAVRLISTWNRDELYLIWVDTMTVVSLIRQPDVSLFYVSEPTRPDSNIRQVSPVATNRSRQVLYGVGELRRLRAIAKRVSPKGLSGPENNLLKRGAMLHADIEVLMHARRGVSASSARPTPEGATLFMDDGQQLGLANTVSHWTHGRRLLDGVRPPESRNSLKTRPDPGADDMVRRWYLAGCAYMLRTRFIDIGQFTRALELFPNDPDVLFFVASVHESFAGVRTQSVMRSIKAPRDVTFDIREQGAELRLAEQLYKRALERNPELLEARIRLGRVLGLRGRHDEAVAQLRRAQTVDEPLLQFFVQLFLGREFEALGNGPEARQSYERAVALAPTAQSALLGLSRLADQAGDRAAARDAIDRVLRLPVEGEERADPWWVYEVVQARNVDGLLADVRQRIAALPVW